MEGVGVWFVSDSPERVAVLADKELNSSAGIARSGVRCAKDRPVVGGTGEVAQHNWMLDEAAIEKGTRYDGYYCGVSSVLITSKKTPRSTRWATCCAAEMNGRSFFIMPSKRKMRLKVRVSAAAKSTKTFHAAGSMSHFA